jgi:hypothetical protein
VERLELVTVFASGDPAELAVAKLVLEAERIPFVTLGEGVQDLFGWGRALGPLNLVTGPVQFQVREQDAVRALQVLRSVKTDKQ